MPAGSRDVVRRVLVDVVECHKARVQYNPARKVGSGGHNKIITLGSIEEQMVADHMERGLGLTQTTNLINLHRQESGLEEVGRSAVYSAHLRLDPVETPISDAKQGTFDEESPWAKARLMWVLQLLIRFGIMTGLAAWNLYSRGVPFSTDDPNLLPAFFTLALIGQLSIYQISFWDETHRKVQVGGKGHEGANSRMQVRYLRDEEGKLDRGGALAPPKQQLKMKYPEETRLCLGVAMTAEGVGRRARPFDNTGKVILTVKDYGVKIDSEIKRVKSLPGSGAPWVTGKRIPNELYLEDPVTFVHGIADKTAEKLAAAGISTVNNLLQSTEGMIGGVDVTRFRAASQHATGPQRSFSRTPQKSMT